MNNMDKLDKIVKNATNKVINEGIGDWFGGNGNNTSMEIKLSQAKHELLNLIAKIGQSTLAASRNRRVDWSSIISQSSLQIIEALKPFEYAVKGR